MRPPSPKPVGQLRSYELNPDPLEVSETLWLTPTEAAKHPDGLPKTGDFMAALLAQFE